jgi:hypothetical protein
MPERLWENANLVPRDRDGDRTAVFSAARLVAGAAGRCARSREWPKLWERRVVDLFRSKGLIPFRTRVAKRQHEITRTLLKNGWDLAAPF